MKKTADDVTAMVLTADEPESMVQRCLTALNEQALAPARVLVTRDITPFHMAFESGLSQVDTPLLLQVDVDMVLDPDCLAVLHAAMNQKAAISLGLLDDPMTGPGHGIKLFNVAALRAHPMPDELTAETRQVASLITAGYLLIEAHRSRSAYGHPPNVLGKHLPDYDDPDIVCTRFRRLGAKVRQRRAYSNIAAHLDRLGEVGHPQRHLAQLAFAEGLMAEPTSNGHMPNCDSVLPMLLAELSESAVDARFPVTRVEVDI